MRIFHYFVIERAILSLGIIVSAVFLLGNDKCQEDYFFARSANVQATATPDPDDDGTITQTPTPTATEDGDDSSSSDSSSSSESSDDSDSSDSDDEDTDDEDDEDDEDDSSDPVISNIFTQLSALDNPKTESVKVENRKGELAGGNWLGGLYSSSSSSVGAGCEEVDSDNDGYVDSLEVVFGTDPFDPDSFPLHYLTTSLRERTKILDEDYDDADGDGLSDGMELLLHTNPHAKDSDCDGVSDYAEYIAGSDPLKAEGR